MQIHHDYHELSYSNETFAERKETEKKLRQRHKHLMTCAKNRKNRKSKNKHK